MTAAPEEARPLVSVVIATYNRSAVLRCTLLSLQTSTCTDWEAIVVGDACTDDTAEVVAALGDARIRFVNRERNHGEQSGPNNDGVALARGRFLAFLNHDDLWFPDHLARAVAALESTPSDLVFCLSHPIRPDGTGWIHGATIDGGYDPRMTVPASTWVFRRELAGRVGPWRDGRTLWIAPSQDWLFRAHRRGFVLRGLPYIGVVTVQSGSRPGSYRETGAAENERWLARLRDDPGWRADLGARAANDILGLWEHLPLRSRLAQLLGAGWQRLARGLGVHPMVLRHAWRFRRRGGFIRHLRKVRGLES